MKSISKTITLFFLALTVMAGLFSCIKDQTDDAPLAEEATVQLTLKLPYTGSGTSTRAITPTPGEENRIDDIVVLAFIQNGSDWLYDYTSPSVSISSSATNDRTVTATVKTMTEAQVFVVLANAAAELTRANPVRFEKMEDIERRLYCNDGGGEWQAKNNGSTAFTPFPMYARTTAQVVDPTTNNTLGNCQMVRMVGRINVTLGSSVANLQLTDACLFNYKTAGYVSYGFSNFSGTAADTPAVPTVGDHTGTPILEPTVFYGADYGTDPRGEILYSIYTFESPAITTDAGKQTGTALVIGGYFDSDDDGDFTDETDKTWYRIDLKTDSDITSNISSGIVRNHTYNIEVQSVAGAGSSTPKDAYIDDSQLTAKITAWNLADQNLIGDGQYYLTTSADEIAFDASGGTENITVSTDYTITSQAFPAGIFVGGIEYSANGTTWTDEASVTMGNRWLTRGNVTGTDGSAVRVFSLTAVANSGSKRYARLSVRAGNFTKVINVSQ